jgi:hypothetical protein
MKQAEKDKERVAKRYREETLREEHRTEDGYEYTYRLTVKESPFVASFRLPLYSISVGLKCPDGSETRRELCDLFADVGKAIVFFNKLVRNLVTPIDLAYVLEDELCK